MLLKIMKIILFILFIDITYANENIIPKEIRDDFISFGINYGKTYFKLRKIINAKLTNSEYDEYITFYYDNYKRIEPNFYDLIRIYLIKNKRIIKIYKIEHGSALNYNEIEDDLKQIKELEKYFGPWNGYYYAYDLNGNGIPELFVYMLGGMGGSFGIYEYNKEKDVFDTILPPGELYNYGKMIVDKGNKSFTIYAHYEPKGDYPAHVLHYAEIEYKWNEKRKTYEKRKLRGGLTYEDIQKITK